MGTVSISCSNVASDVSMVTLGAFDQRIVGTGIVNHVYIGCTANNACTPPDFWSPSRIDPKPAACTPSGTGVRRCGGAAPLTMFSNAAQPLQARLGCACDSVYWVLHQSYDKFTVERNAAGNCLA